MRYPSILARVIALSCFLLVQSGWSASLPDLIDKLESSVVGVGTTYPPRQPNLSVDRVVYLATGFVVGDGLHVVTNAHVIPQSLDTENHQSLAVFAGQGANATAYVAREVRRDEEHDVALLQIQGQPLPAVEFGNSDTVRAGQDIAFMGFPLGMALGLYPVTHRGIVSAIAPMAQPPADSSELNAAMIRRMRGKFAAFQLDATAYPGNSGSPVFELQGGRVVAVINSVVVKETRETMLSNPSGITYAIPAKYITPLLDASW